MKMVIINGTGRCAGVSIAMCTFAEQTSKFKLPDSRVVLYVVLICEVGVVVYVNCFSEVTKCAY
jgi:hypothetical protein